MIVIVHALELFLSLQRMTKRTRTEIVVKHIESLSKHKKMRILENSKLFCTNAGNQNDQRRKVPPGLKLEKTNCVPIIRNTHLQ